MRTLQLISLLATGFVAGYFCPKLPPKQTAQKVQWSVDSEGYLSAKYTCPQGFRSDIHEPSELLVSPDGVVVEPMVRDLGHYDTVEHAKQAVEQQLWPKLCR